MIVKKSLLTDVAAILNLYRSAAEYQRAKNYNVWPEFEAALIEKEISAERHYKIMEKGTIVCVFTIAYNDPLIWEEKDKDPSIYLHRIATNPLYKGRGIMNDIKDWAVQQAKKTNRKYVRMDTWDDNERLKEYYLSCGFSYIGKKHLAQPNPLPQHYWGTKLSLFEIKL